MKALRLGFARRQAPLAGALLLALLAAGCAGTGAVESVEQTNQVQDQRISALENTTAQELEALRQADQQQAARLDELEQQVQALQGRAQVLGDRVEELASEQTALSQGVERNGAAQRRLERDVQEATQSMADFQLEMANELDKVRIQLDETQQLLQSPIGELPQKTEADQAFRAAFFQMVSGELDVAATSFQSFREAYPEDDRTVEALFRRGQSFFLQRKYDHALIPLFELIDLRPDHELAPRARWYLARALEETGDLELAREFYAQLVNNDTPYATDATRRLAFIDRLQGQGGEGGNGEGRQQ